MQKINYAKKRVKSIVSSAPFACALLFTNIVAYTFAPPIQSLPETARAIYSAANGFGICWLMAGVLWNLVFHITRDTVAISFTREFERFLLVLLALNAIRFFGPGLADLLTAVKSDPDGTLVVIVAFIILGGVGSLLPRRAVVAERAIGPIAGSRMTAGGMPYVRPAKDIHRTAIHEAGHLLLFAGAEELPSDLAVTVAAQLSESDMYRGVVTYSEDRPEVLTQSYLHWSMLMHLAGSEAEFIALDERADGATGDNEKWLNTATIYLSAGFGEVFYKQPTGENQILHNRVVLNDLKAICMHEVRDFLIKNKNLLLELATAIEKAQHMDLTQIAPYLARASGTKELPHH